jgi:hypothetical protein
VLRFLRSLESPLRPLLLEHVYSSLRKDHANEPRAITMLAYGWLPDETRTVFESPESIDALASSIGDFWRACNTECATPEMYEEFVRFLESFEHDEHIVSAFRTTWDASVI